MSKKQPVLTFIGKTFAKIGFIFFFEATKPDCPKNCSLYETCQKNLTPNTVYEVIEILKRTLTCPNDLHDEDMVLVKVKIPTIFATMANKDIFEGSIVSFNPLGCEREDCKYINYCEPDKMLIQTSQKVKIIQIIKKIKDCPKGLHISVVKLVKK
jgi:uncharacterized protein (UPF0179 family)